ncbi:FAD-dependent oxidoreductase [Arthrobacter sp. NPDC055138]
MKTSEIQNLKVAVVGGGYAGASAALALLQLGADVHVYEQAPELGEVGAGIGLRPPTVEVLRKWGVFEEFAKVSAPSEAIEVYQSNGELIARDPWPGINEYAQTNHCRMVHRGDVIETLLRLLPAERVHIGHKMITVTDNGDSATVKFENGVEVTADLVLGADGIRSSVRNQIFGGVQPVFSHTIAMRAVISADDAYGLVENDNFRVYVGLNGTTVYFLPLRHRNQVSFDITAPSDDTAWAPEVTHEYIGQLLEGFDERLQKIGQELDIAAMTNRGVYDIEKQPNWHTNSVALVGDAAHAMLHHQGQGANSAMQDAAWLADAIKDGADLQDALRTYQAKRKPITDVLQDISRKPFDIGDSFPETTSFEKGAGVE